jgi:NarL family two-component system response regulator LiaR
VQLARRIAARLLKDLQPLVPREPLSSDEIDVLRLLATGRSNKEMAQCFDVAEAAISSTVTGILDKLHVPSRTLAAIYAGQIGLVPLDQLGNANAVPA